MEKIIEIHIEIPLFSSVSDQSNVVKAWQDPWFGHSGMPHAVPHAAATVVPQVEAVEIAVAPSVRGNRADDPWWSFQKCRDNYYECHIGHIWEWIINEGIIHYYYELLFISINMNNWKSMKSWKIPHPHCRTSSNAVHNCSKNHMPKIKGDLHQRKARSTTQVLISMHWPWYWVSGWTQPQMMPGIILGTWRPVKIVDIVNKSLESDKPTEDLINQI